MTSHYVIDQLMINICDLKKKKCLEVKPSIILMNIDFNTMNYLISNQQKLNTVKPVLRGHLWDKENVTL